jgi:putative flippase GtrA
VTGTTSVTPPTGTPASHAVSDGPDKATPGTSLGATAGKIYGEHGEKLRYLVVGVVNTAASFVAFWLAIRFFSAPLEALTGWKHSTVAVVLQWASWVLMVVWSTTTMKYFAFRSKGHLGKQVMRAYFIYLPAQGLSSLILWVAMVVFGLPAVVGQAFAIFISTIFSYLGHKYFTFRVPLEVGEVPPQDLIERP